MNARLQHSIDQFKQSATKAKPVTVKGKTRVAKLKKVTVKGDSLSTVLRSKRDADSFMSQLNAVIKHQKKK